MAIQHVPPIGNFTVRFPAVENHTGLLVYLNSA